MPTLPLLISLPLCTPLAHCRRVTLLAPQPKEELSGVLAPVPVL